MTTIQSFGIPLGNGKTGGLVQPQRAYAFRIMPIGIGPEASQKFCAEVIKADISLSEKKLSILVRQNITPEGFDIVGSVVSKAKAFLIDFMDSADLVNFSLFIHVQDIKHNLSLDYTNGKHLVHSLSMSAGDIEVQAGEEKPVINLPVVETPKGEFISPERAMELMAEQKVEIPDVETVKQKNAKRKANQS